MWTVQLLVLIKWYENKSVITENNSIVIDNFGLHTRLDKSDKEYIHVSRSETMKFNNNDMRGMENVFCWAYVNHKLDQ